MSLPAVPAVAQAPENTTGLGIDVDSYTGPIPLDVWRRIKQAGQKFVIAQAWGGRSRNEFAASQLSGARNVRGLWVAAYILLNYDDRVCPTFAHPVRDGSGHCVGDPVPQGKPGGRWQVQQGLAALGPTLDEVAFVAIDVEWFLAAAPSADAGARARRTQRIVEALDEVKRRHKRRVIYTRNFKKHWLDITGCDRSSSQPDCTALYNVINDPLDPVPLWDVQNGTPDLEGFEPHGEWTARAGRQYKLDINAFGLSAKRTVDLDVFDLSLFSAGSRSATRNGSGRNLSKRHR